MKTCPDCNTSLPLADFPRNRNRPDRRGRYCSSCMRVRLAVSYRKRQASRGRTVREPELLPEGHKRCNDCLEVKPHEDFPLNKNMKDGRHSYCKPCHNERGRETIARLHGSTSYYHRRRRYGLELGEFESLLEAQGGRCAICLVAPAVHVDHCHETGQVRGLLCFNCNGGLGQFRDRVDILQNAIRYLSQE